MLHVGDKIFYPLHGGGLISSIEEKEILGETQPYYILDLFLRKMQVSIPANKPNLHGIRQVVNLNELNDVFKGFHDGETDMGIPANQRPRKNLDKIKRGDISEGAEVIRDLARINNQKKLGTTEKNMLDNALQLFTSEVALVKEISFEQAAMLVDELVNAPYLNS